MRLRQPAPPSAPADLRRSAITASEVPYVPGEFERFVQRQSGQGSEIRRLGAELITNEADGRNEDISPIVPLDYVLAPGDEVQVALWGSVDADLRLVVDRNGRINIPRVGAIQVSGVRHGDLEEVVARRVAQVFKNFQLSVSLGQLRGIRVFVTGFVLKPGAYTVTSLSTVVSALMRAGGPASSGSFRSVELRRGSELVSTFDLYDLLLRGDRSSDRIVRAGDVIHVNAVGVQVGIVGSVNKPSVVELKPAETIDDALRYAGGFSAVADRKRITLERLEERTTLRVAELALPRDLKQPLSHGDILRAFSAVDIALPTQRQRKRVRVEGEVLRPAEYILPEGSSIGDAIRIAGGFTPPAYVFATELTRQSVQVTQQENYDRVLRDMETDMARSASGQRVSSADDAVAQNTRQLNTARLLDRLRAIRPTGRIVMQLEPTAAELPDLVLEDGDRIFVPARPTTVGVFGSVFNAATYLHISGRNVDDYLRIAGGPTKGADESSLFLVRANGTVVSRRQAGWFRGRSDFAAVVAQPGDTVFVPEEMDRTTFVQGAKDWTLILYQLGIGLAGIIGTFN